MSSWFDTPSLRIKLGRDTHYERDIDNMKKIITSFTKTLTLTSMLAAFCISTALTIDAPNVSIAAPKQAPEEIELVIPGINTESSFTDATTVSASTQSTAKPIIITPDNSEKPTKEIANIYLNFENASLLSVVNYLGEEKKINIIPHKDLETTKVSLTTRSPLTLERAWNVLLTLLEMNGFSLINVNNLYRVVSSKDNGQEPLPTFSSGSGTEPEDLPDNDKVVRYVYFFKSIKVATAKSILSKMIDDKNIIENNDLNAVIIKDQCLNIKAAMKIVKELDSSGLRESIEIIALTWANADNVASLFKDILGTTNEDQRIIRFTPNQQKESAYFSTTTKIIPEPTRNALILLGTQKNVDKIKEFIYKYIDLPIDDAESRLHIKELRYVQAQDMKPIIEQIILPPKGTGSDKGLFLEGGYKVFEDVIISAETNDDGTAAAANASKRGGGNRLIIACNRDDWKRLDAFIDKIDKPQPQVAIEVMIIDIGINDLKDLGGQMFGMRGRPIAKNVGSEYENLSNNLLKIKDPTLQSNQYINLANVNPDNSVSLLSFGRAGVNADNDNNIWAMVQAIMESTNSHVIDQPYIIANNNQKCSVSITKIFHVAGQVDSSSNSPVQRFEDIPATILAEFTPTINLTGSIDLSINISINEFTQVPTSATAQSTKTNRLLTTKASMGAGEVLVLGGLKNNNVKESVYRTPILSEIPIIGSLFFKRKTKTSVDSNLYVFIRPSIIKPRFEGAPDEYTQLKLDYAKYQVMRGDMYVNDTDPIQRWFFKPNDQTIKQKVGDASRGILRPIDDYTYGRNRPKSVDIQEDPYFTVSEAVTKTREIREREKAKQAQHILSARQAALLSRPRPSNTDHSGEKPPVLAQNSKNKAAHSGMVANDCKPQKICATIAG